jgi:hypothetical protein
MNILIERTLSEQGILSQTAQIWAIIAQDNRE